MINCVHHHLLHLLLILLLLLLLLGLPCLFIINLYMPFIFLINVMCDVFCMSVSSFRHLLSLPYMASSSDPLPHQQPERFGGSRSCPLRNSSRLRMSKTLCRRNIPDHFDHPSPCHKRSPAKGVWQKSDEKSDRSIRKSDQKVTERVRKQKAMELLLPTSFCGTLNPGTYFLDFSGS